MLGLDSLSLALAELRFQLLYLFLRCLQFKIFVADFLGMLLFYYIDGRVQVDSLRYKRVTLIEKLLELFP